MKFNSRETYLQEVAKWKLNYADVSARLRKLKSDFKDHQRMASKHTADLHSVMRSLNRLRSDIATAKGLARDMIEDRHNGKILARQQWMESQV